MYLKSIDVFGFKTFADRTQLVFEPGISGIVGPNGSGKSNFVDAVRWVLGEQSARELRGERMDTVIFAGNNRRRPLGMAEVTLTFDNSDGSLSMPFHEVSVTRRVYRSGEGEYFLNQAQVRLRDVLDLFMGSGLGPDSPAIVSQGQIDAILSAKPEVRREIFEEVAGTSKYRARKREAQRRLEQTDANALRINDVLHELEQQMPGIEQQVRRAKRYRNASQRLRDLEILSFVRKTAARREERRRLAALLGDEEAECARSDADTAAAQAEVSRVRAHEYEATLELDERNAARAASASAVQDIAAAQAAERARAEDAVRRVQRAAADIAAAARAVEEAQAKAARLAAELAVARRERDDAIGAAERAADEERRASAAWQEAFEALQASQRARSAAAARLAEAEALVQAAEAGQAAHEKRRAELAAAHDAAGAARARAQAALARLAGESERTARALEEAEVRRERARAEHEERRSHLVTLTARRDALLEVIAAHDAPAGVRALERLRDAGDLRGIVGELGASLTADDRHAVAIDVALDAHAHDVIVETEDDARAALAALQQSRLGRATLLPLAHVRRRAAPHRADLPSHPRVVGKAIDLVRFDAALRPVVERVLAETIVVEDATTAFELAPDFPHLTFVTLAGESIRDGCVSGGAAEGEAGPLQRRFALEALEAAVRAAMQAASDAQRAADATVASHAAALADRDSLARDIAARTAERRDAERDAERARAMLVAIADEAPAAGFGVVQPDVSALRAAASALDEEHERIEAHSLAALSRLNGARDAHREAAALAAALVERVAKAGDDVEAARQDAMQRAAERETRDHALAEAKAEAVEIDARLASLDARRREVDEQASALESAAEALRARRDELAAQARELEEALAARQQARRERADGVERHRIRLAEIDAELTVLAETFAQHPASPAECEEVAGRYAAFEGEADEEIRRLRDELQRLGNVNLNAGEDHQALVERRDFLRQQLDDLAAARQSILTVIAEIDAESQRQFAVTFEKVAAAFQTSFARLFGGGVAKLAMGAADDPTQAGIEIEAQPPGKRMQSLSALSGGERAMTAVALIFAILEVRPGPFYIFDEIDAALDEANIGRFGQALREFGDRAQIIIITHNKATMTLADRLYGITMGEPGVSSILSLALEQRGA